jgi:hypothetical protein
MIFGALTGIVVGFSLGFGLSYLHEWRYQHGHGARRAGTVPIGAIFWIPIGIVYGIIGAVVLGVAGAFLPF